MTSCKPVSVDRVSKLSGAQGPRPGPARWCKDACRLLLITLLFAPGLFAQSSAMLSGIVSDQSGARVSSAAISVRNLETGAVRATTSNLAGEFQVLSLAVGAYELRVRKEGFAEEIRTGIRLAVDQEAQVNVALHVGPTTQQVTVNSDAPFVSATPADINGLVGEQQVKDLPLNGRSYDLLLPLNPGIVNFTSEKNGRHRNFQFDHGEQFRRLRQSPAAESLPAEWCAIHGRGGE